MIKRRRSARQVGRQTTGKLKAGSGFQAEPRPEILGNDLVAIPTATTTVFTTTATSAARTFFARLGDVDREGATVNFLAVQGRDGLLGFFGGAHGHETKAAGAIGHAIHHQVRFRDRAMRGERVLQIVFRGVEGKISDKQFIAHVMFAVRLTVTFDRLFPNIGSQIITERSSLEDLPCLERDKLSNRTTAA